MLSTDELFAYDAWPSRKGENWGDARHTGPYDDVDFHVDLGCGRLPKARIGVDRYACPGVAVVADLDELFTTCIPVAPGEDARDSVGWAGLPFADSSVESIVSHHLFEHIGNGFVPLVEECYRVLKPGGLLRAITPLFPSWAATCDPDHRRFFVAHEKSSTWDAFVVEPEYEGADLDAFSVPYTSARFECADVDYTAPIAPELAYTPVDMRELRVALLAVK